MRATGPLSFHIVDLPSAGVTVRGEITFAQLEIPPDGLFSFPHPVHYELHVTPVQDGVLVRGALRSAVVRLCDRCLDPCERPLAVTDVCYHLEHVDGKVIHLTEGVREDILLVLPSACLCREDCRGLCPTCGENRNRTRCTCEQAEVDASPWGGLDSWRPPLDG
ncbi:MAG: DUF177 domain-containing protein [Lentisphaeria bacterium]|nr:DUF177 domain-containing protein [Lentisphaeria bacterium]